MSLLSTVSSTPLMRRMVAVPEFSLVFGPALVLIFALLAVFASVVAPDPNFIMPSQRLQFFSLAHPLGTDGLGRDLFARIVYGGGISLMVGISVAVLATVSGLVIGLVAGYFRFADLVIMRIIDGIMAIPTLLLAVAMTTLSEPSVALVVFALMIPDIPRVVRVVRAEVLSLRTRVFVAAAVASGTSGPKIMLNHILPNLVPVLAVQVSYICAAAILHEASLSFIGAGMPAETPSWGVMIAENRQYFVSAPWAVLVPGACISILILGVSLFGDAVRDRFDVAANAK